MVTSDLEVLCFCNGIRIPWLIFLGNLPVDTAGFRMLTTMFYVASGPCFSCFDVQSIPRLFKILTSFSASLNGLVIAFGSIFSISYSVAGEDIPLKKSYLLVFVCCYAFTCQYDQELFLLFPLQVSCCLEHSVGVDFRVFYLMALSDLYLCLLFQSYRFA